MPFSLSRSVYCSSQRNLSVYMGTPETQCKIVVPALSITRPAGFSKFSKYSTKNSKMLRYRCSATEYGMVNFWHSAPCLTSTSAQSMKLPATAMAGGLAPLVSNLFTKASASSCGSNLLKKSSSNRETGVGVQTAASKRAVHSVSCEITHRRARSKQQLDNFRLVLNNNGSHQAVRRDGKGLDFLPRPL